MNVALLKKEVQGSLPVVLPEDHGLGFSIVRSFHYICITKMSFPNVLFPTGYVVNVTCWRASQAASM